MLSADFNMGNFCKSIVNTLDAMYGSQATSYLQTPDENDFGNSIRSFTCFAETSQRVTTLLIVWPNP